MSDAATSDAATSDAATSDAAPLDAAPMDFALTLSSPRMRVVEGASVAVGITISRNSFIDPVDVTVAGLPSGVSVDPLTIEGETGALTLHAAADATQGDAALTITATSGSRSHEAPLSLLAMGPPGTLDQSFTASIVPTGPAGRGTQIIVQPDGKILTVAAVAFAQPTGMRVARYLSNGTPDPSFSGGTVLVPSDGKAAALAVQTDGKVIVAGGELVGGRARGLVARLESDGSPDNGFGTAGRTHLNLADADDIAATFVASVALQGDGGIVVVGSAQVRGGQDTAGFAAVVARLTPSGALDPTFGTVGIARSRAGGSVASFNKLVILPDGRIITLGSAQTNSTSSATFARFTASGQPDNTFNGDGSRVMNGLLEDDYRFTSGPGAALAIQSDGKIAAVGASGPPPNGEVYHSCLMRLNGEDGSPDASFGTNGTKVVALGSYDHADGLAIQPDGKWVVVGQIPANSSLGASVARFTNDALLDLGFGGGVATPVVAGNFRAVTLDTEGRFLVTGDFLELDDGGNYAAEHFILARIWP
jgi:uncharacterized delta-60 repeat protein